MASASLLRPDGHLSHDPDTETNRLLPPSDRRRKRHQVRIQGRLALVRSVSTLHLPLPSPLAPSPSTMPLPAVPRHDPAVGSVVGRTRERGQSQKQQQQQNSRQRSLDGGASDTDEEDIYETARRDRQRRGYGIGGAGNIRRPTEVLFLSSKRIGGTSARPRSAHGAEQDTPDEQAGNGTRESRTWAWMRTLLGRRSSRTTESVP